MLSHLLRDSDETRRNKTKQEKARQEEAGQRETGEYYIGDKRVVNGKEQPARNLQQAQITKNKKQTVTGKKKLFRQINMKASS